MCGVIGIVSRNPVNQALYDGLTVMQHRGQDAAGIVTWGEDGLKQRRANGLVRDVFRTRHMLRLPDGRWLEIRRGSAVLREFALRHLSRAQR